MRIVSLPDVVSALAFDIDLTLYDSREYYDGMEASLTRRLAQEHGKTEQQMAQEVAQVRADFARDNGGRKLSMGNTFLRFGIPIDTSVRWREELFRPEDHFGPDARLIETMEALSARFGLCAVTNNPTSIGERTLRALGVESLIPIVIGLDVAGESKPTLVPFRIAADRLGVPLTEMVSIGDRFAVDVELPVANGMGGIVVDGVADVYALPRVLAEQLEG